MCRASAGVCDLAESCDDVGNDCPADAKSTAECRATAGVCDVAEACDGVNADCPSDAKSTAVCRSAVDDCDTAESCDGVADTCPADLKQPDGTACDDDNACTQPDACQSGACGGPTLDCDDNDGCTADSCNPMGGCVNDDAPAADCMTADKKILLIKRNTDGRYKGQGAVEVDQGRRARPNRSSPTRPRRASYALCIYAGTANTLIARRCLAAGYRVGADRQQGLQVQGHEPQRPDQGDPEGRRAPASRRRWQKARAPRCPIRRCRSPTRSRSNSRRTAPRSAWKAPSRARTK